MNIKYDKYPLQELYVILNNTSKEKYPEHVAAINKEIQFRTSAFNFNQEIKSQYDLKQITRWKRFCFFRKAIVISAFLILLFCILGSISKSFNNSYLTYLTIFFICISCLIFCISCIYTTFWKCPRCEKYFCTGTIGILGSNIPFRNTCIHCGYRLVKKE